MQHTLALFLSKQTIYTADSLLQISD